MTHNSSRTTLGGLLLIGLILFTPLSLLAQSAAVALAPDIYVQISRRVLPSVVNITIEPKEGGLSEDEMEAELRRYFLEQHSDIDMPYFGEVSGSGVLIDRRGEFGYVLTNYHVVRPLNDSNVMNLTFHLREEGGTDYNRTTVVSGDSVRVIGRDELSDLAVIEFVIPEPLLKLEPVPFGDSDKTEIGEFVLALGNPLNFNHTITQGIISGKSRFLGSQISLEDLIQTDAVIQPGNSGGPLVNLNGEIVGINNAIISRTGLWQGVSFAIPSNDAQRISSQLIDLGRVTRGYLGVTMEDVARRREIVPTYQLDGAYGVLIKLIVPNSPADLAGLHISDVVVEIDGRRIANSDHMLRMITEKPVNGEIRLGVVRLDPERKPQSLTMVATLGERPNETVIRDLHDPQTGESMIIPRIPEEGSIRGIILGMKLEPIPGTPEQEPALKVIEVTPGSEAFILGVNPGDIITHINRRVVRSLDDANAAVAHSSGPRVTIKGIRPDGEEFSIEVDAIN